MYSRAELEAKHLSIASAFRRNCEIRGFRSEVYRLLDVSSIAGENSSVVVDEIKTMVMEMTAKPLTRQNSVGSTFKFLTTTTQIRLGR
ncbi:MAG: hypothetical protein ACK56F_08200 [bacterium]